MPNGTTSVCPGSAVLKGAKNRATTPQNDFQLIQPLSRPRIPATMTEIASTETPATSPGEHDHAAGLVREGDAGRRARREQGEGESQHDMRGTQAMGGMVLRARADPTLSICLRRVAPRTFCLSLEVLRPGGCALLGTVGEVLCAARVGFCGVRAAGAGRCARRLAPLAPCAPSRERPVNQMINHTMRPGMTSAHQMTPNVTCTHSGTMPQVSQPQGPRKRERKTHTTAGTKRIAPSTTAVTIAPAEARPRNRSSR